MRHPPRLDSASGKTLMPFPCFDLCLTAWRESETVFHGTVVGAAILDFFAMGVFLDDLEVDAFLFGIVTIISLTGNDSRGWNAGIWDARLLVIANTRLLVARAGC